jgi:hypothetical protein
MRLFNGQRIRHRGDGASEIQIDIDTTELKDYSNAFSLDWIWGNSLQN